MHAVAQHELEEALDELAEHLDKLKEYAAKDEDAKRLAAALDAARASAADLPRLHETLLRLAAHKEVAAEDAEALRRLQQALVELALAVIAFREHVRDKEPVGFEDLPVPPYDLWLPFKAGCGCH